MATGAKRMNGGKEAPTRDIVGFVAFLAVGVSLAVAHWWLAGPPQIPSFDFEHIQRALTRSEVTSSDAISVARTVGWAALLYLGVSTALRLVVGLACRLSDGSAWSAAALRFTDFATIPAVRRVVDGAIIGVIVLSFWMRERAGVEASASFGPSVVAFVPAEFASPPEQDLQLLVQAHQTASVSANYMVKDGESFWSIARRLYGDGSKYVLLFQENRVLPTGENLDDPRLLQSGQSLNLPLPMPNLWVEEDLVHYRVQSGDSLWRIAESFLDDGFRWLEIWDLNRGKSMTDGRPFSNPDLIYPGWVLVLPVTPTALVPPEVVEVEEAPQPTVTVTPVLEEPTPTPEPESIREATPVAPAVGTDDEGSTPGGFTIPWPGHLPVLATAAGLAGLVSSYLLVRGVSRRLAEHRSSPRPARNERRPNGDAGRVVLASRALMAALAEASFADSRLTRVREAARYQDCYVECPPGDADALAALRYDLGRRLACGVDTEVLSQTEVRVRLSRFQRLAGLLLDGETVGSVALVPAGGEDGCVYYLNLSASGTVLITGTDEQARQLLSGWLQALESTCRPDELSILIEDGIERHLPGLAALAIMPAIVPRSTLDLLDEMEDMILARERAAGSESFPLVLAIVRADDQVSTSRLDTIQRHGRGQNLTLLIISDNPEDNRLAGVAETAIYFRDAGLPDDLADWEGEGDLVLLSPHRQPLGLHTIAVRKESVPAFADMDDERVVASASMSDWTQTEAWQEDAPALEDEADDEEILEAEAPSAEPNEEALWAEGPPQEELVLVEESVPRPATQLDLGIAERASLAENGHGPGYEDGPIFSARLLGKFEIAYEETPIGYWRYVKSRELLAYLLCHGGGTVAREAPAEALWPDALPGQAEKLLYNAIYYLRQTLKAGMNGSRNLEIVTTRHQFCRVELEHFNLDTVAFDAHIRRATALEGTQALAEYERGLSLYSGDLFDGEFEWAAPFRQDLRQRFAAAARQAGKLALECRDAVRSIAFYRMALDRDAIDEDAARGLMQAYAARSDVNGIKKAYRVLCEALRRELDDKDAHPLPDTETLFEELTRRVEAR